MFEKYISYMIPTNADQQVPLLRRRAQLLGLSRRAEGVPTNNPQTYQRWVAKMVLFQQFFFQRWYRPSQIAGS